MNFMIENWFVVALSLGLVGSAAIIACGGFLLGVALWKPQAAHDALMRVRCMIGVQRGRAVKVPSSDTSDVLASSDL